MSGPVDWLPPEVALSPVQAPEAAQELAFVEDQVSIEDTPFATDDGFAASDTVGTGAGGGGGAEVPSPLPPPPQAERLSTANRTANAKSVLFDKTTPRFLVALLSSIHESSIYESSIHKQGGDRRTVPSNMRQTSC